MSRDIFVYPVCLHIDFESGNALWISPHTPAGNITSLDVLVTAYALWNDAQRVALKRGMDRFADKIYQDYPEEMKRISDRRISTKVFISKANGAALKNGTIVGTPYVADKNVGATETFITIGGFNEKVEAENLSKFIKTKFARILLSILKVTADNTKEKWAKVPLQDFTQQYRLDKTYTRN